MNANESAPIRQRVRYFFAGILVVCTCACVLPCVLYLSSDPTHGRPSDWLKVWVVLVALLPVIAIGAVLFFRVRRGPRIRAGAFVLGCLAPPALFLALVASSPGPSADLERHVQPFDAELWRDQEQSEYDRMSPPRLHMVNDLLAGGSLQDLTKEQVVELLGPSARSWPSRPEGDDDFHYLLGPVRGGPLQLDEHWLRISFADDGRVDHSRVYQD